MALGGSVQLRHIIKEQRADECWPSRALLETLGVSIAAIDLLLGEHKAGALPPTGTARRAYLVEGSKFARIFFMNKPGQSFFPTARFSPDKDGNVGVSSLFELIPDLFHRA